MGGRIGKSLAEDSDLCAANLQGSELSNLAFPVPPLQWVVAFWRRGIGLRQYHGCTLISERAERMEEGEELINITGLAEHLPALPLRDARRVGSTG